MPLEGRETRVVHERRLHSLGGLLRPDALPQQGQEAAEPRHRVDRIAHLLPGVEDWVSRLERVGDVADRPEVLKHLNGGAVAGGEQVAESAADRHRNRAGNELRDLPLAVAREQVARRQTRQHSVAAHVPLELPQEPVLVDRAVGNVLGVAGDLREIADGLLRLSREDVARGPHARDRPRGVARLEPDARQIRVRVTGEPRRPGQDEPFEQAREDVEHIADFFLCLGHVVEVGDSHQPVGGVLGDVVVLELHVVEIQSVADGDPRPQLLRHDLPRAVELARRLKAKTSGVFAEHLVERAVDAAGLLGELARLGRFGHRVIDVVGSRQPHLGVHHVPHLCVDRMLRERRRVGRQVRVQLPHHSRDARPLGVGNHRVPVLFRDVAGDLLAHIFVGERAVGLSHRVLADYREQADLPQLDVAAGKCEVGVSGIHVLDRCGAIELARPLADGAEVELLGVPRVELVAEGVLVLVEPEPLNLCPHDRVLAVRVPVLQPFVEFRGFSQDGKVGVGRLAGRQPEGQVVAFPGEHRVGAEQLLGLVSQVHGAEQLPMLGGQDVARPPAGYIDGLVRLERVDLPGHIGPAVEPLVKERRRGASRGIPRRRLPEVVERVEDLFRRRVGEWGERGRTRTETDAKQVAEPLVHRSVHRLVAAEIVPDLPHCFLPVWCGVDHILQRRPKPGHAVAHDRPHVQRRFGEWYSGVLEALERCPSGERVVRGAENRREVRPHLGHGGLWGVLENVGRLGRLGGGGHGPESPLQQEEWIGDDFGGEAGQPRAVASQGVVVWLQPVSVEQLRA